MKGNVRLDWLRSRFYELGDVLVYLDGRRKDGVRLAGWWDLGWSIGKSALSSSKSFRSFQLRLVLECWTDDHDLIILLYGKAFRPWSSVTSVWVDIP